MPGYNCSDFRIGYIRIREVDHVAEGVGADNRATLVRRAADAVLTIVDSELQCVACRAANALRQSKPLPHHQGPGVEP